jgi:hypothetical protein
MSEQEVTEWWRQQPGEGVTDFAKRIESHAGPAAGREIARLRDLVQVAQAESDRYRRASIDDCERADAAEEALRETGAELEGVAMQPPANTLGVIDGDVVLLPAQLGSTVTRIEEIEQRLGIETALIPGLTEPWVLRKIEMMPEEDADLTRAPQVEPEDNPSQPYLCQYMNSDGQPCGLRFGHEGDHAPVWTVR